MSNRFKLLSAVSHRVMLDEYDSHAKNRFNNLMEVAKQLLRDQNIAGSYVQLEEAYVADYNPSDWTFC